MTTRPQKTRAVEIEVWRQDIALWTCAAALEPVPPTLVGPMWRDILAVPVDGDKVRMTLHVPVSFITKKCSRLEREHLEDIIPTRLTQQAVMILERHGLQPIPFNGVDEIPF